MQAKVSKGLATWAGLVAAVGQYAAAVAVFLDDPDKATALGPLTTATVTLAVVIYGRMAQATAQAGRSSWGVMSSGIAEQSAALRSEGMTYAGSTPRPHAYVQTKQRGSEPIDFDEDAPDPYPPAGPDDSIADPTLDDPGHLPTTALHSKLKG